MARVPAGGRGVAGSRRRRACQRSVSAMQPCKMAVWTVIGGRVHVLPYTSDILAPADASRPAFIAFIAHLLITDIFSHLKRLKKVGWFETRGDHVSRSLHIAGMGKRRSVWPKTAPPWRLRMRGRQCVFCCVWRWTGGALTRCRNQGKAINHRQKGD